MSGKFGYKDTTLNQREMIGADRVREALDYHPETGEFYWRVGGHGRTVGNRTGQFDGRYIMIQLDGRKYYAHRLAWLYVHGTWPETDVDHINENKTDNRLSNLRVATRGQNMLNITGPAKHNRFSGVRGVSPRRGRWRATISGRHLGDFDTIEEAAAAREAAR